MKLPKWVHSAGFTMIELLVVIAVIGVLAVAVLSSINPIEQINKGRDTRIRSDAAQLINAVDRFFSIHEKYPWNMAKYNPATMTADSDYEDAFPADPPCAPSTDNFCVISGDGDNMEWLDALTTTSEVKPGYVSRLKSYSVEDAIRVSKEAVSNATMYTCFRPSSQGFKDEAVGACYDAQQNGGIGVVIPAGACPAGQGAYTTTSEYDEANPELICLPALGAE